MAVELLTECVYFRGILKLLVWKWKWSRSVLSKLFVTQWTVLGPVFLHPWDFPGKNTGVGCHFLLQEIFLTQGLNSGLPHCKQILYRLSHQGSHIKKKKNILFHINSNQVNRGRIKKNIRCSIINFQNLFLILKMSFYGIFHVTFAIVYWTVWDAQELF